MASPSHSRPSEPAPRWERYVAEIARAQAGLRTFLRTLLACSADVDDVLQETNLVLWRKRGEYDESRPFGPWARRVAYFQTLAHLKNRSRSRESGFSEDMLEQLAEDSAERSDTADRRLAALRECLAKLPADDRRIVLARYEGNASVQKMARAAGRSADALSMHLYRLRKKLADCIERSGMATAD